MLPSKTDTPQTIVLVTPVWNDSERLAVFGRTLASALAASELPVWWVIADDGSDSEEAIRYATLRDEFATTYANVKLLRFGARSRKGGAVYDAWINCEPADYYAFFDADGAVSAETVLQLIKLAMQSDGRRAVIATRPLNRDALVERSLLRKCVFRAFRRLVRGLVGLHFEDTQCGAKVIPGAAYRAVAGRLQERGFIFDVELLVALKHSNIEILEQPIEWREMSGSRIRLSSDSIEMMRGLVRIRRRLRAGDYSADRP